MRFGRIQWDGISVLFCWFAEPSSQWGSPALRSLVQGCCGLNSKGIACSVGNTAALPEVLSDSRCVTLPGCRANCCPCAWGGLLELFPTCPRAGSLLRALSPTQTGPALMRINKIHDRRHCQTNSRTAMYLAFVWKS